MEKITAIIPTIPGREDMLKKLILSLPKEMEIIVVDDKDLSLAAKRNKGARQATREYLLFIDDDNYVMPGSVEHLLRVLKYDGVGLVGMMAVYDDKKGLVADGGSSRSHLTGFTVGHYTNKRIADIPYECYKVDEAANAFAIAKWLFDELGGFNEKFFPIDLDEADLCCRVRKAGFAVFYVTKARVVHKSITYSHIPDFRRPKNAYFMGRNRIIFQALHLPFYQWYIYFIFFMPIFIIFYCASLLYRQKAGMIKHFLKGALHGITGNLEGAKRYTD